MLQLPSEHQIKDAVWLTLWSKSIAAEVHAVYFTESKVMYDLKVFGDNGDVTRIRRVDSAFVSKTKRD